MWGPQRRVVRRAAALTLALCAGACTWSQQRPLKQPAGSSIAPAPSGASSVALSEGEPDTPSFTPRGQSAYSTPVELSHQVAFAIQQVEGTSAAAAGALLAPAADPVGRCTPKAPGALQVKVTRDEERTDLEVVPGSSVDAATRRCMLAALAMLDADDVPVRSGTPSAEPRSFSSTVSISW